jgi:hypothetical protein
MRTFSLTNVERLRTWYLRTVDQQEQQIGTFAPAFEQKARPSNIRGLDFCGVHSRTRSQVTHRGSQSSVDRLNVR